MKKISMIILSIFAMASCGGPCGDPEGEAVVAYELGQNIQQMAYEACSSDCVAYVKFVGDIPNVPSGVRYVQCY